MPSNPSCEPIPKSDCQTVVVSETISPLHGASRQIWDKLDFRAPPAAGEPRRAVLTPSFLHARALSRLAALLEHLARVIPRWGSAGTALLPFGGAFQTILQRFEQ